LKLGEYLAVHGWTECEPRAKGEHPEWQKGGKRHKAYDALLIEWRKVWRELKRRTQANGKTESTN
jgi:hypothetical protein